jgi:predicted Abi (CAAX) family protease
MAAAFNRPDTYPLSPTLDAELFRPVGDWTGRLILPTQASRQALRGVWLEVYHAPPEHRALIGQRVLLRWQDTDAIHSRLRRAIRDVRFTPAVEDSQQDGLVHPTRLNHWTQVDPLESLAGSRPLDDMVVKLDGTVGVDVVELTAEMAEAPSNQADSLNGNPQAPSDRCRYPLLTIEREPIQISGRYYALVTFLQPEAGDRWQVAHFNRTTRQFDGAIQQVVVPEVVADRNGCRNASNRELHQSPANKAGWYVYGAHDREGQFIVQAIAPRLLLQVQPDSVVTKPAAIWRYLKRNAWHLSDQKGQTTSTLLCPQWPGWAGDAGDGDIGVRDTGAGDAGAGETVSALPAGLFMKGDRHLLIHLYGGIGGENQEPAAKSWVYFGHYAYGLATVIYEPLADELSFDITYYQIYTHNLDGIIAGKLAWNRYMGDRQFGWLGTRPVVDILIKLDALSQPYALSQTPQSALDVLLSQLEVMGARYRIGDGTGGTYVGPAHNCAQDSNQALYTALRYIRIILESQPDRASLERNVASQQLLKLGQGIKWELLPLGAARADWKQGQDTLGISPEEELWRGLRVGLLSWRTLMPRLAAQTILHQFHRQQATFWVLRTCQVGGSDPTIEPIAPTQIGF